ncbi:class I tRNA ligase family protein [Candidatus Wolfebacteria bacterium]|nr:class I tRNA ligase family protein [Candidatus Wolfebacteria bacterium]
MSENPKNFNINDLEEKVLKFWQDNKTFEKSFAKPKTSNLKPKTFVFYDGPPFATGTPHYGHIVASVIKDAVPRYWTMKGYQVKRRWGWDCHGLPIENISEKELGIKRKKEIEKMGIGKFNEFCRSKIFSYVDEWKKVISRLGRWVDMENSYKTMDASFMESVWWTFKQLWDKGLIYENYRSMHICTRCETTLSQQEVSEGYKDIKDLSATVKFELVDPIRTNGSKEPTSNGAGESKTNPPAGGLTPKTYILAWTTTPWTLPGNAALAINNNFDYIKIRIMNNELGIKNEFYILAKDRLAIIKEKFEIINEFKGKDLIGKKYKPLFDYYENDENLKNRENGWKIYGADFVTTDEGTGVVHIAPAFGEDDFKLMEQYKLPFIQHIGMDGIIKPEARDFAGMSVKPIGDHQKTDIEIIKNLAGSGLLFAKEKYEHSYPHCWRCDTPLINYATSSWFVNVLKIKDKAIKLAKDINWSPSHIKEGRFGKWLEGARDWSISRQRYWASAMPIWKCEKCKKTKAIGSIGELKNNIEKSGNKYFAMRHGEAENNAKNIIASKIETAKKFPLTLRGKKQVLASAKILRQSQDKIDLIFVSDFLRAKETAEIVAEQIGLEQAKIIYDKRLWEINTGIFDGQNSNQYSNYFSSLEEKFYKTPENGENLTEFKNRITEFLYEIENKYSDKNILIISHEYPIWCLFAGAIGADVKKAVKMKEGRGDDFIKTGELMKLDFIPLPHNGNYELDLHRPYIDKIEFDCECAHSAGSEQGGKMKRVADVLDTWFDSGSMPYSQAHYPFENKKEFEKNFPAQFIAEGLDQTRAWFYYLHLIATAIKDSRAFNNVIVNGIVLAEDGKKMAKRLNNYPDPMEVINKYGADALRLYLLSSPVVRAENLNFSEEGVDEVYKKVIMRLWNVYQFYELYADKKLKPKTNTPVGGLKPKNILDKWIFARLNQLISEITEAMDKYELDKATRPIGEFIEDLSTWYIRRSRDRFKNESADKKAAIAITRFVLIEFSKTIAPFAPFMAETIYQGIKIQDSRFKIQESAHLEEWPKADKKLIDKKLLEAMAETRKICSLGLEARQKAGIKVRQPLASLKIKNQSANWRTKIKNNEELINLIKDEINVKKIIFDAKINLPAGEEVELDTKITPELKAEGDLRELIRAIQDLRKKAGFNPQNKINLAIETDEAGEKFIKDFENEIKKGTNTETIKFEKSEGEEIKIDELKFKIKTEKCI